MELQKVVINDSVFIPANYRYVKQDIFTYQGTRFNLAYVLGRFDDAEETVFTDYIYVRDKQVLQKISVDRKGVKNGYIQYDVKAEVYIPAGTEGFEKDLNPVLLMHNLSNLIEITVDRNSATLFKEGFIEQKLVTITYDDAKEIAVPLVIKPDLDELDENEPNSGSHTDNSTIVVPPVTPPDPDDDVVITFEE